MIIEECEMFTISGIGENGLPEYKRAGTQKIITLTPDQYSVDDEPVLIPEKISEAANEN